MNKVTYFVSVELPGSTIDVPRGGEYDDSSESVSREAYEDNSDSVSLNKNRTTAMLLPLTVVNEKQVQRKR